MLLRCKLKDDSKVAPRWLPETPWLPQILTWVNPTPLIEITGLWAESALDTALSSATGLVLNGSLVSFSELLKTGLWGRSESSRVCQRRCRVERREEQGRKTIKGNELDQSHQWVDSILKIQIRSKLILHLKVFLFSFSTPLFLFFYLLFSSSVHYLFSNHLKIDTHCARICGIKLKNPVFVLMELMC